MKQLVISSIESNRQFAFVKGNRPTNAKTVKAKEKSMQEHGQLSPITVVKGEDVCKMNGCLVDLQGHDIPNEQAERYYAVVDGQHRVVAWKNLKKDLDELVICESLNAEMEIAALIAEMNICTTSWKGTDYMAAPAMALAAKNEVFDFAVELQGKGFPLATISLWCTGANSLKPKDLVACVKSKELPKAFGDAGWFHRSVKWYMAASERIPNAFLAKKYLITFLIKKFNPAEDPMLFSSQMEEKLISMTEEQVQEIMNPTTEETVSREQAPYDMLEQQLG